VDDALQLPLLIGLAGTLAGMVIALFSAGLSRLPVWRNGREFAWVALTGAGYCACDLVTVLAVPPPAVALGVQAALFFGIAHGLAWLWYLAALEQRPIDRFERIAAGLAVMVGLVGLVSGTIVTSEIVTIGVPWFGAIYRVPRPTPIGAGIYGYLAMTMTVVALRAARRRAAGGRARWLVAAVAVLGVLGLNDTLVNAGRLSMPMLLDAGSMVVVLAVGFVNQQRLAEHLSRTQQALVRSERLASTSRLAAGIAHEINNPAAVIQGELDRIQASRVIDPHVANARHAVDRIVYVVRQLLDLGLASRPGSAVPIPFAVSPVVERAAATVAQRFRPGTLTISAASDLWAFGDPSRVEAVLVNLLNNAAHAVETWAAPHASVRAFAAGGRVTISVTDNGPGLPPQVVSRLFEPFISARPVGQGAGLGLAVAHGLMLSQNGGLRLVTTSSLGTELAIDIPPVPPGFVPAAAAVAKPFTDARKLAMLIIDDDADVRVVLKEAAEAQHFEAAVAATVADALAIVAGGADFDVVLSDLMMPDGGAETWLRVCRAEYPALAARTIIITGGPSSPEGLAVADANEERLLYKPFAMADVRAMAMRWKRS
jgi:signal transduction histidine kinase/CheY-like chemotaxis protein